MPSAVGTSTSRRRSSSVRARRSGSGRPSSRSARSGARSRGSTDSGDDDVATSAKYDVVTAARRASRTSVASGGGSVAGSRASTSVSSRTAGASERAAARAVPITSCTRVDADAGSRAATAGAASSTQRAPTAAAALRTSVALPTPSAPATSTPSRGEPPRRVSSSGRRKVSSSHSTSRRAASAWPTRSSRSRTGSAGAVASLATPLAGAPADVGVPAWWPFCGPSAVSHHAAPTRPLPARTSDR